MAYLCKHFCEVEKCSWCRDIEIHDKINKLIEDNRKLHELIRDLQRKINKEPRSHGSPYDLTRQALYRRKYNLEGRYES